MNGLRRLQRGNLTLAGIALVLAWFPTVRAHDGEPPHMQAAAAIRNLKLAPGDLKWPTDAPLRSAMAGIRAAYAAEETRIDQVLATDEVYERLATRVEEGVERIVSNSRLPPDAEASLHYVVADMVRAANLMHGKDPSGTPRDGAEFVHAALHAYERHFDDPDWRRPREVESGP